MKRSKKERGSVSIEASISLVVFTFVMVCVLWIINVSRAQMHLQMAADKAAKEINGYLYLYKLGGLYNLDQSMQTSGKTAGTAISKTLDSFDQIAAGVEAVTGQVNQSVSIASRENISDEVKKLVDTGQEAGKTIQQEYGKLNTLFSQVADNPVAYLRSLGALTLSYGLDEAKSYLIGSLLAKNMAIKYLGGETAADALLNRLHVENGVDGLDFSDSSIFNQKAKSANPAQDVNIVIRYRMNVAPLMGKAFMKSFAVSASARGWLGGDTDIDRLKNPNPISDKTGSSGSSTDNNETPAAQVTVIDEDEIWAAGDALENWKERNQYVYNNGSVYVEPGDPPSAYTVLALNDTEGWTQEHLVQFFRTTLAASIGKIEANEKMGKTSTFTCYSMIEGEDGELLSYSTGRIGSYTIELLIPPGKEGEKVTFTESELQNAILEALQKIGVTKPVSANVDKYEISPVSDGDYVIPVYAYETETEDENDTDDENVISTVELAKLETWEKYDRRPSDELYLKYKDVFNNSKYYDQLTGEPKYPSAFGGRDPSKPMNDDLTLEVGFKIDRYGDEAGGYASPYGTSYTERSLAIGSEEHGYHVYKVAKEITGVEAGITLPWFGEEGGGVQFRMPKSIQELIEEGYLVEVTDEG